MSRKKSEQMKKMMGKS